MLRREVERVRRECRTRQLYSDCGEHGDDHLPTISPNDQAGGSSNRDDALPALEPSAERRKLVPGARLLRDWNGRTHAVDVTESGYLYKGETYRSLSTIVRRITGAHWSGPRFFGL